MFLAQSVVGDLREDIKEIVLPQCVRFAQLIYETRQSKSAFKCGEIISATGTMPEITVLKRS